MAEEIGMITGSISEIFMSYMKKFKNKYFKKHRDMKEVEDESQNYYIAKKYNSDIAENTKENFHTSSRNEETLVGNLKK